MAGLRGYPASQHQLAAFVEGTSMDDIYKFV